VARDARRERVRFRGSECCSNPFKNSLSIHEHVVIPESENTKTMGAKPLVTITISGRIRVLSTVNLHHKPATQASKVDDVRANRNLTLELHTPEAMCTQPIPEPTFGVGHLLP
jgi:hypothetical protein